MILSVVLDSTTPAIFGFPTGIGGLFIMLIGLIIKIFTKARLTIASKISLLIGLAIIIFMIIILKMN